MALKLIATFQRRVKSDEIGYTQIRRDFNYAVADGLSNKEILSILERECERMTSANPAFKYYDPIYRKYVEPTFTFIN